MIPPPPVIPTRDPFPGGDAWVKVLADAGYPTTAVTLDFETEFSKDYHMMGKGSGGLSTVEYICDPRFSELGLAVLECPLPFSPRTANFWSDVPALLDYLQRKYGDNLERCTIIVQNARFDCSVLAFKHDIHPPYVVDVINLASHLDARAKHGLAALCEQFHLPAKGDTMQFKGVTRANMTPEQARALSEYSRNDAEREMDLFALLLPRLTWPNFELRIQQHTMEMFTRPGLHFDFEEADKITVEMQAEIEKALAAVGCTKEQLSGNISFQNLLADALPAGESVPMKPGKKGMILDLAKDDDGLKILKRHHVSRVRDLIAARQAVKSWPLHVARVERMAVQARPLCGLLPNPEKYYGAHTGRWSGSERINLQNLGARGLPLIARVRHTLIPPPDHVFAIADASQIEARVLAWLAGQEDLVEDFRLERDIYSTFSAEHIFHAPCRKPRKDDPEPVKKLLTKRRDAGKVGILGLGFGMGKDRMLDYMESYPALAPIIESGEIDVFFTKDIVDAYRRRFPMIPAFWRNIEDGFRFVTRYPEQVKEVRCLKLWNDHGTVVVRLPSSRCLFYPHAACGSIADGARLRFMWGQLWGGTLTENVVQAIARDVLALAVLEIEAVGFRVLHHVHDEVIALAHKDRGADCLELCINALRRVPAWAMGLPLNAEGQTALRYGK